MFSLIKIKHQLKQDNRNFQIKIITKRISCYVIFCLFIDVPWTYHFSEVKCEVLEKAVSSRKRRVWRVEMYPSYIVYCISLNTILRHMNRETFFCRVSLSQFDLSQSPQPAFAKKIEENSVAITEHFNNSSPKMFSIN